MRSFLGALLFCILSFLPFYLYSSPKGGNVSFVKLSPQSFEVKEGKEGGQIRFILSSDPKNPKSCFGSRDLLYSSSFG